MDFTPGNASLCLVLGAAAGNSSLSEVSKCWGCEEQLGFDDHLLGNNTNCTECLQNVCTDFVAKQNWHHSWSMVLVAVLMGILMLLGIPGNIIVLVVYYFKQEKTTANKFMMALASIDLHACLVIHPYIISKCFNFYSPITVVCKIFEYLIYVSQGSQGLTLIAVAVDRYHAVMKPLEFGYADNAAYIIAMCFGVGAAGSIPMILFYGKKTVWLYDQQREIHIRTHVCHYSDEYDGSRDQFIYIISTLVLLLMILVVISILYILIAVRIRNRNKQVGALGIAMGPPQADSSNIVKQTQVVKSETSSPAHQNDHGEDPEAQGRVGKNTTTSLGSTSQDLIARPNEISISTALDIQPIAHCSSTIPPIHNTLSPMRALPLSKSLNVQSPVPDQSLKPHTPDAVHPPNKNPAGFKGCKLLFIVTIFFFLSWLPFWVLRFVENSEGWWENIQLTNALLSHLFFLNNAVNPILYAFINKKFREECRMTKKKISTRLRYMCS